MLFIRDEKVFSLSRTAAAVPSGDIKALFEEFYCYLLVTGFYREGEGDQGLTANIPAIMDKGFSIPSGSYSDGIGRLLSKGVKDRLEALWAHRELTSSELELLNSFNAIFSPDNGWYANLSGRAILRVAYGRGFSVEMMAIARYVAAAFGQTDYPEPAGVPKLYLSALGNIHLAKHEDIVLEAPTLRYGSRTKDANTVSALWSFLSAQISSLSQGQYPGNDLGDTLAGLKFLNGTSSFEKTIPIPRFAEALYMQRLLGIDGYNPVSLSAAFYREFLYGSVEAQTLSRRPLLGVILNLMMEKMGESRLDHLFTPDSFYQKLLTQTSVSSKVREMPTLLQFALEALDGDSSQSATDQDADQDTALSAVTPDPDTENNGYDPSAPPPVSPVAEPNTMKNTIGLISFDKSGEGVDEELYRAAVVALNDRLRSDDTLEFSSDIKDRLDQWVNGWIYRAAISATKDQIAFLGLQSYLKVVSTKG